jgi:uncharacterized protein (DUF983 family)
MSCWTRAVTEPEVIDETYDIPLTPLPNGTDHEPRAGDTCPRCQEGRLDYDGLLKLVCPKCGYAVQGCFT